MRELTKSERDVYARAVYQAVSVAPDFRPVLGLLRPYYDDSKISTAYTDCRYRIFLCPDFFADGYSEREQAFDVLHECMHNVYLHAKRAAEANLTDLTVTIGSSSVSMLNFAGDLEINTTLKDYPILECKDGIFPSLFGFKDRLSMEKYAELTLKNFSSNSGGGDSKGSGAGSGAGSSAGYGSGSGGGGGSGLNTSCGGVDTSGGDEADAKGFEAPTEVSVAIAIQDLIANMQVSKDRSFTGTDFILGTLTSIYSSKINYGALIRRKIDSYLGMISKGYEERSYSHPSRYYQEGIVLRPGPISRTVPIGIAIDCSGSMGDTTSDRMYHVAAELSSILKNISSYCSEIKVVTGDVSPLNIVNNPNALKDIVLKGGGGTVMAPLMDKLVDQGCKLVILLSDMEFPFSEIADYAEKNRRVKFIFINVSSDKIEQSLPSNASYLGVRE